MVKAYLRYEHSGSFGVIAGAGALAYDPRTSLLAAAALEDVSIWNVKQASLVGTSPVAFHLWIRPRTHEFRSTIPLRHNHAPCAACIAIMSLHHARSAAGMRRCASSRRH